MSDLADQADDTIARELEASIAAARGIPGQPRTHCADCGATLADHRRERGRCFDCQLLRELKQRAYAVGV